MAELALGSITKRFGDTLVLDDVSLEVADGRFCVLVGPSGCGKTTLLRIIAGLERQTSGTLTIGGRKADALAPAARGIAMVFQSYALYPHMTAYNNMAFGLRFQKLARGQVRERVRSVADMLEISDLLHRKPGELSGGQRQRVAIGRAIVRNPKLFLFDEPLSNLDAALRAGTRLELARLHKALGTTMVYVTHDQIEAMTLAQDMVVMRNGRIEQKGTPEEVYRTPASLFVAEFLGAPKINVFRGEPAEEAGAEAIAVRPEHVRPVGSNAGFAAKIVHVERLGSESHVHMQAETLGATTMRADGDLAAAPGDTLRIGFAPEHLLRFDADGKALPPL